MRAAARQTLRSSTRPHRPQPAFPTPAHRPAPTLTQQRRHESSTADNLPQTHYDFFPATLPRGPPPRGPFAVDVRALRAEFLRQQAAAHPDRHPAGAAKRRAEALSARINEAYKVLADPLLRAQYVLQVAAGIDVADDETAKVDDAALLLQVLEAREVIEGAPDEAAVRALQDDNQRTLEASVAALERALDAADWPAAAKEAVRLRYWVNIREACVDWEQGKPVTLQH